MTACPEHGPPSDPEHRFCEVCGRNLTTGEGRAVAVPTAWLSSRAAGAVCGGCGSPVDSGDYCDHCGRRRSVGRDHAELDLGTVAAVTDVGRRRRRNEDAVAVGRAAGVNVAVVCDGVATASRSDAAAHDAAEAAVEILLATGSTVGAARAAAAAARAAASASDGDTPPSCTYVSGVVTPDAVTVGWVGDSRAYWLGPEPAGLTVDDSVAALLAAGRFLPPTVDADPDSRALIRWLGADSGDPEPQVVTFRPTGPGTLLLCSDGLHHYASDPVALTAAVAGPLVDVARRLTDVALGGGGHDNIAVALLAFPPSGGSLP
ncbi:protein phosphatase 2C domain-containing protein [Actinomycetes bacterium KLBMP 9797]